MKICAQNLFIDRNGVLRIKNLDSGRHRPRSRTLIAQRRLQFELYLQRILTPFAYEFGFDRAPADCSSFGSCRNIKISITIKGFSSCVSKDQGLL